MKNWLLLTVGIAATTVLAAAGCTADTPSTPRSSTTSTSTPIPVPTVQAPTDTSALDSAIAQNIFLSAYNAGFYLSEEPCGCSLDIPDMDVHEDEVYPRGTPVWLVRISATADWTPWQDNDKPYWDVTGTTITGQYENRPDSAVFDGQEGPNRAEALQLPWQFEGLFPDATEWLLQNDKPQSFVLAIHVPAGAEHLVLTVDIPSEPLPTDLELTVPDDIYQAALDISGDTP